MTDSTTKYLFFTGKGGVGKTSLACATAVEMADSGKVVLLALTRIKLERCIRKSVDENINPVKVLISFFAINMTLKIQLKNIEIELLNL
jgi:arsenite-transporting ATPase